MKKVLVISHSSFSLFSGNGKTLHSIFNGWQNENLCHIFFQNEIPSSDVFQEMFKITDLDMLKLAFSPKKNLNDYKFSPHSIQNLDVSPEIKTIYHKFGRQLHFAKFFVREAFYSIFLIRKTNILNELKKFEPDFVFFMGSYYSFGFNIARNISNSLGIKLNIYLTDDYLFSEEKTFFSRIDLRLFYLRRSMSKALKSAHSAFVISEEMRLVYENEFNRKFELLNNYVVVQEYESYKIENDLLDFVYAGGLSVGRHKALIDFMAILSGANLNKPYQVCVYATGFVSDSERSKLLESRIQIFKPLYGLELENRLRKASFLLHVESVLPRFKAHTRFSISTKLTEYLAYGRCIIAYGPKDISSISLILKNDLGLVLDANLKESNLIDAFQRNVSNYSRIRNWSYNAYVFAKNNYNIANPKLQFIKRINEVK